MDPFTEKELIDMLRSIANSLKDIRAELADMSNALREIGAGIDIAEEETEELDDKK